MRRLTAVFMLFAGAAHAHPNHPSGVMDLVHLLTEPDHLAMLLIPAGIAAGIWFYRRKGRSKPRPD